MPEPTEKFRFLFSVIVPTHNRPERLGECLESITRLEGDRDQVQVVVVNDGSSAQYGSIIARFERRLNLKYERQENRGPATARNRGAALADGRFLVFLDDDCTLPRNWLRTANVHAAPGRVTGGRTLNGLRTNMFSEASQVLVDYLYSYYNADPQKANFLTTNNFIIPRNVFFQVKGFDTDFTEAAAEDRDLCDRLLRTDYEMVYTPEVTIYHWHAMTLKQYLRQHFTYGYRARLYHEKRAERSDEKLQVEPISFYVDLLLFPFHERSFLRGLVMGLLLIASQAANGVGFSAAICKSREKSPEPVEEAG